MRSYEGQIFPDADKRKFAYEDEQSYPGCYIHAFPQKRKHDLYDSFDFTIQKHTDSSLSIGLRAHRRDIIARRRAKGKAILYDEYFLTLSFGEFINRIFGPGCEVYEEEESALFQREPSVPPVSWQNAERATAQKTQQMPQLVVSATANGATHESLEQMPTPNESRELHKQPRTTISAKQISKSSDEKDCLHHFGYLNELPKNTPIPGECFGCPKIVDCLITAKGKRS